MLAEVRQHAPGRGDDLFVLERDELHRVAAAQQIVEVRERGVGPADRLDHILDADPPVGTAIEERERLAIEIDAADRHREREPQLLIQLGERAEIVAVTQADLIDPTRSKEMPAVGHSPHIGPR